MAHPHFSPAAEEPLPLAPAFSPAHCPLCAFQSVFWQPAPQYVATVHTEHFFSGTPVAPHDQQSLFFLPADGRAPSMLWGGRDGPGAVAAGAWVEVAAAVVTGAGSGDRLGPVTDAGTADGMRTGSPVAAAVGAEVDKGDDEDDAEAE